MSKYLSPYTHFGMIIQNVKQAFLETSTNVLQTEHSSEGHPQCILSSALLMSRKCFIKQHIAVWHRTVHEIHSQSQSARQVRM